MKAVPFFASSTSVYVKHPRYNQHPELDKIIQEVIDEKRELFRSMAVSIRETKFTSFKPNKTGSKVDVRAKIAGKTLTFHFCTQERVGHSSPVQSRTLNLFADEFLAQVASKIDVNGGFKDKDMMSTWISIRSRTIADLRQVSRVHAHRTDIYEFMSEMFLMDGHAQFGINKLFQGFQDFLAKGGMDGIRNAHQSARAVEGIRSASLHAFRHGMDVEDIVTVVRECLVQSVFEA